MCCSLPTLFFCRGVSSFRWSSDERAAAASDLSRWPLHPSLFQIRYSMGERREGGRRNETLMEPETAVSRQPRSVYPTNTPTGAGVSRAMCRPSTLFLREGLNYRQAGSHHSTRDYVPCFCITTHGSRGEASCTQRECCLKCTYVTSFCIPNVRARPHDSCIQRECCLNYAYFL